MKHYISIIILLRIASSSEYRRVALKSYKTNGHANGELEVTFMHEFQRSVRHCEFVSLLSQEDDLAGGVANLLLKSDKDVQGTIASLTKEIGAATADGK